MRNIFLILLFTNLLLIAWQLWIVPPDAPDPFAFPDASIPELEIWSDGSTSAAAAPEPSVADNELSDTGERCVRVGPFADLSVANAVRDQLIGQATTITRSSEQGEVWVGHWVQIIGLGTRQAAETAVAELVNAGIADAYIVQFEPSLDISLGVYRSLDSANNVIGMAGGLGYVAVMEDRVRPTVEHWLAARLVEQQSLQLDEIQLASGQILRTESIPCAVDEEASGARYQPPEPGSPLKGPTTSAVTQPP